MWRFNRVSPFPEKLNDRRTTLKNGTTQLMRSWSRSLVTQRVSIVGWVSWVQWTVVDPLVALDLDSGHPPLWFAQSVSTGSSNTTALQSRVHCSGWCVQGHYVGQSSLLHWMSPQLAGSKQAARFPNGVGRPQSDASIQQNTNWRLFLLLVRSMGFDTSRQK